VQPSHIGRFVYLVVAGEISQAQREFVLAGGATSRELAHWLRPALTQVG
jgi:hypothetical protein